MSSEQPPEDLKVLAARLDKARSGQDTGPFAKQLKGEDPPNNALGMAFRTGIELVSALAVGTGVGWGLDYWLGTAPWLMLVFILLGGVAGIFNVYKMASGMAGGVGYRPVSGAGSGNFKSGAGDGDQRSDRE
jgi:ATP synthase protein I